MYWEASQKSEWEDGFPRQVLTRHSRTECTLADGRLAARLKLDPRRKKTSLNRHSVHVHSAGTKRRDHPSFTRNVRCTVMPSKACHRHTRACMEGMSHKLSAWTNDFKKGEAWSHRELAVEVTSAWMQAYMHSISEVIYTQWSRSLFYLKIFYDFRKVLSALVFIIVVKSVWGSFCFGIRPKFLRFCSGLNCFLAITV